MNIPLDGGLGLIIVVGVWLLVMVPSWGKSESRERRVSTRTRNLQTRNAKPAKNSRFGVSRKENFGNKIRRLRQVFALLLLTSLAAMVFAVMQSFAHPYALIGAVVAFAVASFSVSVLRTAGAKRVRNVQTSDVQRSADRARMAYFIREAALPDTSPDELFDERAWTASTMPDSLLSRQYGSIDMSQLAEVVSLDEVRSSTEATTFDSQQLDQILNRRRNTK